MDRSGDRSKAVQTTLGVLLCAAALGLHAYFPERHSDHLTMLVLFLGAGLVNPGFVIDFVRAWRGRSSKTDTYKSNPKGPT